MIIPLVHQVKGWRKRDIWYPKEREGAMVKLKAYTWGHF